MALGVRCDAPQVRSERLASLAELATSGADPSSTLKPILSKRVYSAHLIRCGQPVEYHSPAHPSYL